MPKYRFCKHCRKVLERPRIQMCDTCKTITNLWNGMLRRPIYDLKYAFCSVADVPAWHEFWKWAYRKVVWFHWTFYPTKDVPSVHRVNPEIGYVLDNLAIIPKRLNSGLLKSCCFKTDDDVRKVRRLRRAGWTATSIAAMFGCSIRAVSDCVKRKTYARVR